ncbi:MAG: HAMP domain-containing sensor histidine kinase [Bacteroidetes bacterium]|nr:HAMP domain-containing sensor histidine kinase [Bacteroidota bacterium]
MEKPGQSGQKNNLTGEKELEKQILSLNQNLEEKIMERTQRLNYSIQQLEAEIQKRSRIEEELIKEKVKAEESDRLKSNFLANMSHEFRTPLNGVLGNAEILLDENRIPTIVEPVKRIQESGLRLLRTIDSIILISRLQSGQEIPDLKEVDVVSLVLNEVGLQKERALKAGLYLETKMDDVSKVFADKEFVAEVLRQLLDNAIKFTQEGGVTVEIRNREMGKQEGVLISLRDTGLGIADSQMEMIFENFRQISEGWGRHYEGNGLGLSICKLMVEKMKGEIWVEQNEPGGSILNVWLLNV